MTSLFPESLRGFHLDTVPRSLASPGSSSRELYLPFRVLTAPNLPHAVKRVAPSLGFRSPSRHQQRESTSKRASQFSLFGPSSAFLTLSTGCSSLCLAGLFHPAATSGIHLSGALLPAAEPRHLVGGRCPPVVQRLTSAGELPHQRRPQPPRLQGFDPGSSSRPPTRCLALPTPRSPPRFQLPRAFLRIPGERLHALSAHDLDRQTLRVTLAAGLQRIDQYPTWYSVPRLPSRSSFLAYPAYPPKRSAPSEARLSMRPTTTAEQSRVIALHVPRG